MNCHLFFKSHVALMISAILLSSNSVVAGNKEECSKVWKTPNEVKSCILLKGFESKSRYENVLKRPTKPYGYRSFKFRPIKELLKDGQTHIQIAVELIVSHSAFQYFSIRDIAAEMVIRQCILQANPQKTSTRNIKNCILQQLRTLTKRNYTWKQEPVWDVGFLEFKIQLQKREKRRNQ